MQRYNKAWAAGLAQALVQIVAAFATLDPSLEQSAGVLLTAIIVFFAPANKEA